MDRTGVPIPNTSAFDLTAPADKAHAASPSAKTAFLESETASGHSRLGHRFLARLFGYKGELKDGQEVEEWLLAEEMKNPRMRGMMKLWEKWNETSPLLLTVVDYDETKNLYDPSRLFSSPAEELEFTKCVAQEIAELKCANFSGNRDLGDSMAQVYYSKDPDAQVFCEVRMQGTPIWRAGYEAAVNDALSTIQRGSSVFRSGTGR